MNLEVITKNVDFDNIKISISVARRFKIIVMQLLYGWKLKKKLK